MGGGMKKKDKRRMERALSERINTLGYAAAVREHEATMKSGKGMTFQEARKASKRAV